MAETHKPKILVVDDEAELKNALVEALSAQSFDVCGFTNPLEALAALQHEVFDVVLSDLMMPEMDGIDLVEKAHEIDPHLIAIIMTGQGTIQTAVDAMKVGAFDYMLKPFRMAVLLPTLTRAILARRLRVENLQLRETVAIYELCQTIAFTLDQQTLISKLADAAVQQTEADEVSILLPTQEGDELYVAAVRGEGRQRLLGERVPLEESISGWVVRSREPLLLTGEVADPRFHPLWPHPEIKSSISIPMQVGNQLIGSIHINAVNRPRPFTLGQMKALAILASTAAAALQTASLYTQVQDQRERLDQVVATVPGVVWEAWGEPHAATQRINFVSDYVETMLGYSVEEWLSTPNFWLQIVHPDDRAHAAEVAAASFASGDMRSVVEFRWTKKDGSTIWVESTSTVIKDETGKPVGVRGVTTDISERKRAEEAVRASEAEMKALFRSMTDVIIVFDRDGRHLKIAPTKTRQLYRPVAERLGKTIREIFPVDKADLFLVQIQQALLTQHTQRVEYSLDMHGELRWYDASVSPMTDDTVVWVARDITERKKALAQQQKSEERYRDLVENAHDIIYSHDLAGNYTSMNKAGGKITGYTIEEALKLNITETVAPGYLPKIQESMQRKLSGESVTAYEIEIVAKDGRHIPVEVNTKYVYEDGVAVGIQGIARDVTERRQLEEQLRQSQKMEAIGQLAGGVAHDFNNLLTAINGYTGLALRKIDERSLIKPYLEEVQKAGERAANLTRQLLAFGRKQILQPVSLDLNNIVSDMNKMLRRLIGEDIMLTAKLADGLRTIKADPGQVEQVLVNLVVNARDAMPYGGHLTIETVNVELGIDYAKTHLGVNPGNYVMLAVSDTGTGMSEEVRGRIFEPFFTTKDKDKGTGLGLSTVYGIVQQSGGSIWVYSEPDQGTSFKVYLPEGDSVIESHERRAVEEEVARGSETVLLVEDEDVVRGLAAHILEDAGYRVIKARGGDEAIEFCSQETEPIDLLLTDVVMPEKSGKEVADRVTSMRPRLKVLFMSGYTDEAIVNHGVLDSGIEFIQKPFTPLALSKKVREVLDSNGHPR
jgi:PAS domain S-box-containing protein